MTQRSIGFTLPTFTTAQLAAFVTQYGPTGTIEVNSLQPGNLVFNLTTGKLMVFDGTTFVAQA